MDNDDDINALAKSMKNMSSNFTIRDVQKLIDKYGLSCRAERIFQSFNGDEQSIKNALQQQYNDKALASNRNASAFFKSSRSGISKGGKKSRRNTRRRKYSKKQKPSRKQTRRHRRSRCH